MKKKLDDLKKEYSDAENERKKTAENIKELEAEKAGLEEKARLAAGKADEATFTDLKRKAEFLGYRIEILRENLEASKDIVLSLNDVKEAWTTEEKARRDKLNARAVDLEKAIDQLKIIVNDICKLENEGLKNRNVCATLAGLKPYSNNDDAAYFALAKEFPMEYFSYDNPSGLRNPEVIYYLMAEKRYKDDKRTTRLFSELFNKHLPLGDDSAEYVGIK